MISNYLIRTKENIILIVMLFLVLSVLPDGLAYAQCEGCSSKQKQVCGVETEETIAQDEEWEEWDSEDSTASTGEDEWEEFDESSTDTAVKNDEPKTPKYTVWDRLYWPLGALFMTALAGVFVRYKTTRKLRPVFLVASMVFLGFYVGACPCPISSLSYTVIGLTGGPFVWESMVWFLGLIPITYIFGKVWCGWICHLGAMQKFLYTGKFKIFHSERSQKVMKIIRWVLVIALIVQLIATHSYLFDKIDPFRIAYNLGYGANLTSWILLGLLLLSSLFIHRPFCKSACPIGLMLGWVSKIPGASVIGVKEGSCTGCKLCGDACKSDAIVRKGDHSILDNQDCIACGECLDSCRQMGLGFYRKGKKHNDKEILCRKRSSDAGADFLDREFS
jgi:Fe-S-cluster-containing hydrogenase component 2